MEETDSFVLPGVHSLKKKEELSIGRFDQSVMLSKNVTKSWVRMRMSKSGNTQENRRMRTEIVTGDVS